MTGPISYGILLAGGYVKFGMSKDPAGVFDRRREAQRWHFEKCELLGITEIAEKDIHDRFEKHRSPDGGKECFALCDEIQSFIDSELTPLEEDLEEFRL